MRIVALLLTAVAVVGLLLGFVVGQPYPIDEPRGVVALDLLGNKSVQKELKLTTEQIAKIKELDRRMQKKLEKAFEDALKQKLSTEEGDQKLQAVANDVEAETAKLVKETLEPDQVKRFKQIERQVAGPVAFTHEDVAKELKLTEDQKNALQKLVDTLIKETRELLKGKSGEKREAAKQKARDMRQEALEKATDLLSADQKKEWKEMLGAAFEWKPDRPAAKLTTPRSKDSIPDFPKTKKKG
jgi:hypothetical protein